MSKLITATKGTYIRSLVPQSEARLSLTVFTPALGPTQSPVKRYSGFPSRG